MEGLGLGLDSDTQPGPPGSQRPDAATVFSSVAACFCEEIEVKFLLSPGWKECLFQGDLGTSPGCFPEWAHISSLGVWLPLSPPHPLLTTSLPALSFLRPESPRNSKFKQIPLLPFAFA